ncbi:glutamate 5-kinase [bacterium]|nr:glutamate 5-kinase [bacterium]
MRRLVVKIGTATLCPEDGLDVNFLDSIAKQVKNLQDQGISTTIVTSGAIGLGRSIVKNINKNLNLVQKQALAAVGQGKLINYYSSIFENYGLTVAQVLLTREDLANRKRFLNARNTLEELINLGIVPVINENDTVATEEIKLGDNDQLSALVATLIDSDLLIILSNVKGLYDKDPRLYSDAKLIKEIHSFDEIPKDLGGPSEKGSGGMITKILAVEIAARRSIPTIIASGREDRVIERVVRGESVGTLFHIESDKLSKRKIWIGYGVTPKGKLYVDQGAYEALAFKNKSLLSQGIKDVEGEFSSGDAVSVISPNGEEFARGIVYYSSTELEQLKGKRGYHEVIHRDNLVILHQ